MKVIVVFIDISEEESFVAFLTEAELVSAEKQGDIQGRSFEIVGSTDADTKEAAKVQWLARARAAHKVRSNECVAPPPESNLFQAETKLAAAIEGQPDGCVREEIERFATEPQGTLSPPVADSPSGKVSEYSKRRWEKTRQKEVREPPAGFKRRD
jgi:hypothetical protein